MPPPPSGTAPSKPGITTPAGKPSPSQQQQQQKLAPKPAAARPSPSPSTSTGVASTAGFVAKIPVGSPFKPKDGLKRGAAPAPPKSKPMTFQEVESKQKGASRATTFSFLSPAAV